MKITNDEEYFELLERIRKGAEFIDSPIIKPADLERGMAKYDRLCQAAREYRETSERRMNP